MKPQQMMFRGNDNKKPKITQAEKVHNFVQKMKRKAAKDALAKGKTE